MSVSTLLKPMRPKPLRYWRLAWTPPEPVKLTIRTGKSFLTLPVRQTRETEDMPAFGDPVQARGPEITTLETPEHQWLIRQDLGNQWTGLRVTDDRGCTGWTRST